MLLMSSLSSSLILTLKSSLCSVCRKFISKFNLHRYMAAHLKPFFYSSKPLLFRPFTQYFYNPIKRYTQEVRAPSLAEEFRRVAEVKAKSGDGNHPAEMDLGIASQTFDKAVDATQQAVTSDSDLQDVKNKYEKPESDSDHRKTGN